MKVPLFMYIQHARAHTGRRSHLHIHKRARAYAWLNFFTHGSNGSSVRARRLLTVCLIGLILSASGNAADFNLKFTVPPRVEFYLSTDYVDLGLPQTRGGVTYFEGKNLVKLSFRVNTTSPWEIHISGVDFRSAAGTSIPISRLQWRTNKHMDDYSFMAPEGERRLVMDWVEDAFTWQHFQISYYLELTGDEYEGVHSSVITYSLFIP